MFEEWFFSSFFASHCNLVSLTFSTLLLPFFFSVNSHTIHFRITRVSVCLSFYPSITANVLRIYRTNSVEVWYTYIIRNFCDPNTDKLRKRINFEYGGRKKNVAIQDEVTDFRIYAIFLTSEIG